ncbi:iron-siderophore ABC transporter substrate-binding protein [Chloroflexia bacterium SDU3-3]|nr:iron-siderophore ABC transporter substrate-binding protein [Chloroflexia bacterium SDU3-3]
MVTHALGKSEVPAHPQRVVVLDAMDDVLALGITPVGAANWVGSASGAQAAFPPYLDQRMLAEIAWLGDNKQPDLETIVRLKPDLILGRTTWHEAIYKELSAIAPTVIVDQKALGGWKGQFLAYADALNKTAQAQGMLDAYEARAASIKARLAQLSPAPEVSLARFDPGRIVIYERQIFAGSVLEDAGVRRPAGQDADESSREISVEELAAVDGDVLLVVQADAQNSTLAELSGSPLWAQLKAVKSGRVVNVSFDVWVGGWTITGANLILDDLERHLLASAAGQ